MFYTHPFMRAPLESLTVLFAMVMSVHRFDATDHVGPSGNKQGGEMGRRTTVASDMKRTRDKGKRANGTCGVSNRAMDLERFLCCMSLVASLH